MSGWIKLHRGLIDWEWYTDHNTCRLFIHCILRANHADTKWRGQKLNRGQFITSLESLSNETGLSVSQIRTSFSKLKSTDEIASLSQARSRVITVLKYDQYQSDDRLSDKQIASESQADDKQIATDKNVIIKEVNNKNTSAAIAACPHIEIINLYNEILPEMPAVNPSLWNGTQRASHLKARWNQSEKHRDIDFWRRLFTFIRTSDFLMGQTDKPFQCSLGWIVNNTNFVKIIENNFKNRG